MYFKDKNTLKIFTTNETTAESLQLQKIHDSLEIGILSFSTDLRILNSIDDMAKYVNNPSTAYGYIIAVSSIEDLTDLLSQCAEINTNGRWLFLLPAKQMSNAIEQEKLLLKAFQKFYMLNVMIASWKLKFCHETVELVFYNPFERSESGERGIFVHRNVTEPNMLAWLNQALLSRMNNVQGHELNITFVKTPSKYLPPKKYFSPTNSFEKISYIRGALLDYMFAGINAVPMNIQKTTNAGLKLANGTMTGVLKLINDGEFELSGNTQLISDLGKSNIAFVWTQFDELKYLVHINYPAPTTILNILNFLDVKSQWISLLLFAMIILCWYFSSKLDSQASVLSTVFNFISVLHNVSIKDDNRNVSNRCVFALLLLYALIITNSYQGSIVSQLSIPSPSKNIQTIKELLATNLPLVSVVKSQDLFKPDNPNDTTSTDYLINKRQTIVPDLEIVEEMMTGKQMALLARLTFASKMRATQFNLKTGQPRFHIIPESPIYFLDALIIRRDSPFLESYNRLVRQSIEAGFYRYGEQAEEASQNLNFISHFKNNNLEVQGALKPIAIENLLTIFWIYGACLVSCLEKNSQNWRQLLTDHLIIIVVAGIWVSTSAMSILEPCLPVWLISNLHPKKWQLGTVFIPDSIGYLIGTNCFGDITYKYGQLKFTAFATMLVGVSCIMIPNATTVIKLLPPHFTLGLGIGIVDAALVPLLATFMDTNDKSNESDAFASHAGSHYGLVYAIQQTAVSLAYSLAPIIGGELAQTIGFPWLMGIVGTINLFYSLTLLLTMKTLQKKFYKSENMIILKEITTTTDATNRYTRFYNSVD